MTGERLRYEAAYIQGLGMGLAFSLSLPYFIPLDVFFIPIAIIAVALMLLGYIYEKKAIQIDDGDSK